MLTERILKIRRMHMYSQALSSSSHTLMSTRYEAIMPTKDNNYYVVTKYLTTLPFTCGLSYNITAIYCI